MLFRSLAYRPLNVTADADMAIGLQGEQRGLMVVLEAGLTAKQINSIEKGSTAPRSLVLA